MPFTRVSWDQEMDLEGPDLVKYIWSVNISDPYVGYGGDVDADTPDFTPEPFSYTFYMDGGAAYPRWRSRGAR